MASIIKRRETGLAITLISAMIMFIPYFFKIPVLEAAAATATVWATIINAFAVCLVIYTMSRRQYLRVRRRVRGWPYGVWMLFGAWWLILTGLILDAIGVGAKPSLPFKFFVDSIIVPADATIYSILCFYMTSACARAFRARNLKALLLMIIGFFVLMKQAPIGAVIWPPFEPIGAWIGDYLVMAANRVFLLGVGLGAIALCVRVLTGRELAFLGVIGRKE